MIITFIEYFFTHEGRMTGEIPNIAYIILQDELWCFSCPSCPRDGKIASDHLKSYEKKRLGNRWILNI